MDSTMKFTGKAEGYARYRPHYPEAYLDYLLSANSLGPGSVVADIGSGTGILTGQLLGRGLAVLAVEPNSDMRAQAEKALGSNPLYTSIDGSAEATMLPGGCADLATAAQAFHWFDRERFRAECRRILKPDTKVALVWNSRVHGNELVQENERICSSFCPAFTGFGSGIESDPDAFVQFFRGGAYEMQCFPNDETCDLDGFIGRCLTGSYAPSPHEKSYTPFISALTRLFEEYATGGMLTLPSETHSYLGFV